MLLGVSGEVGEERGANLKAVSGLRWSKEEVQVKALAKMAKVGLNALEGNYKDVCQLMHLCVRPQNVFIFSVSGN